MAAYSRDSDEILLARDAKGTAMPRRYSAFMVRCWALGDGTQRAEIECIPSGETLLVDSPLAALDWIVARIDAAQEQHPVASPGDEPPGATTGGGAHGGPCA